MTLDKLGLYFENTQLLSPRLKITRHRASTSTRWHFAFGVVIATKPAHRLRIRPIVHN